MNCFSCFTQACNGSNSAKREPGSPIGTSPPPPQEIKKQKPDEEVNVDTKNIQARNFNFRELATATKNFRQECLLGEGGFGRVYRGTLPGSGQIVAVKQLDRNGMQGNKEFLVEVLMLSLLQHENLVDLIGYCADGDQRLLVHEFMSSGSLEDCLFASGAHREGLDWYTRMKIASGAARGLEYLHDRANPPVIFRDLKSSNILLDQDSNPKLSDFGLAKLGPGGGDKPNPLAPASRVVGTYGYAAPEYARSGELTLKSDVYSFGVVLLELITGRRAIDTTKPNDEQNLVSWAQPIFREPKRFPDMADPKLNKRFPEKDLNQAVAIAAMCLQEEPLARPLISDVVVALSFLSTAPKDEPIPVNLPAAAGVAAPESSEENMVGHESGGGNLMESDKGRHGDVKDVEEVADHLENNDNSSDESQDESSDESKNWHSSSWNARSSDTSSRKLESNSSLKSNGKGSFESDDAIISSRPQVRNDSEEDDQGSVSAGHTSREGSQKSRRVSRKSSRKYSRKGSGRRSEPGWGSSSDSSYSSDSESEDSIGSQSSRRSDYGSFKSDDPSTSRVASRGNISLSPQNSEGSLAQSKPKEMINHRRVHDHEHDDDLESKHEDHDHDHNHTSSKESKHHNMTTTTTATTDPSQ